MGSRETNFYVDLTRRVGFGGVADEVQSLYLDGKRDEAYAAIVAYVLWQNGVPAGDRVLEITADATITGATGAAPDAAPDGGTATGEAAGTGAGPGGRGGTPGGTETYRRVNDFRPVGEAELADPDPGDWLMYRRTFDGQGYSPLSQIDTARTAPG